MDANVLELKGQIVDVVNDRIFSGAIYIHDGQIVDVKEEQHDEKQLIMPGLVDAHIHIESSMLVPSEYAKIDVVNGGVAAVCDPHEIANVLGMEGVKYMIEDGKSSPYKFFLVPRVVFRLLLLRLPVQYSALRKYVLYCSRTIFTFLVR